VSGNHPVFYLFVMACLPPGCSALRSFEKVASKVPEEDWVVLPDQRVHVERWGDSGPNLVLLHGFAASTYSFRELGPLLGRSHQVTAIDLNGFGFTERPVEASAYSLEGQLATVSSVLDALNIERATVVGHSFGGQIAMRLADQQPERVESLILISPPTKLESPSWWLRFGPVRVALYPLMRLALSRPAQFRKLISRAYHQKDLLTNEVAEAYRQRLLVEGLWHAYRGFGASLSGDPGPAPSPVQTILVVAGRHDAVIPLEDLETFVGGLPQAHLHVLEKSGHSSPEEEPEALAQAIQNFLKERR
jgi:pimeloyl-ACP methyl ester carboxylesterase